MLLNDLIKVVYVAVPLLLTVFSGLTVWFILHFKVKNPENSVYELAVVLYGLLVGLIFWLVYVTKL